MRTYLPPDTPSRFVGLVSAKVIAYCCTVEKRLAPEDTAETIRRAIKARIVSANLLDGIHKREQPLFPLELAVARIRAARQAGEAAGVPFVINARTDVYLVARIFGRKPDATDFDEAVRRGRAYREAGADCIFIPGLEDRELIGRLVTAVGGPSNVMAGPTSPSVPELKTLGVARVSVGPLLAEAAFGLVRRARRQAARLGHLRLFGRSDLLPGDEQGSGRLSAAGSASPRSLLPI